MPKDARSKPRTPTKVMHAHARHQATHKHATHKHDTERLLRTALLIYSHTPIAGAAPGLPSCPRKEA